MLMTQLNPTIPVMVTSKDNQKGTAIAWLDYGQEHYVIWGVALDSGEVWWVPNSEIRLQSNWTMQRRMPKAEGKTLPFKPKLS